MSVTRILKFCAVTGFVSISAANATTVAEDPAHGKFDWMVGCWEKLNGNEREVWSVAEGNIHFGYSVALKNDTTSFFEHLRIEMGEKSRLVAYPMGRAPTAFEEEKVTLSSASFVNPSHDYPQRIRYERKYEKPSDAKNGLQGGRMIAAISKLDGSEQRVFEMRMCTDRSPLN